MKANLPCHNTVLVQIVMLSFRFSQKIIHASDSKGIYLSPSGIIQYVFVPVMSLVVWEHLSPSRCPWKTIFGPTSNLKEKIYFALHCQSQGISAITIKNIKSSFPQNPPSLPFLFSFVIHIVCLDANKQDVIQSDGHLNKSK